MIYQVKDMTGLRFGRLVVVKRSRLSLRGFLWKCKCDCDGKIIETRGDHLRSGNTRSCGCLQKEKVRATFYRHGAAHTREYHSWHSMIARCCNPKTPRFKDWGGRGIKVCRRWQFGENGKHGFECFYDDMGDRPIGKGIDRKKNNKGYSKSNCRWATPKQQANNRRKALPQTPEHCANISAGRRAGIAKRKAALGQETAQP
jgi:hypothetical protein